MNFFKTCSLLSLSVISLFAAAKEYTIDLNQGAQYAAPTNIVTLYRTTETPKNIWVNLTTSLTKLEKDKSDGSFERTYRSDLCPEEYKTELAEAGKSEGREIVPLSKVECVKFVENLPCQRKKINYFMVSCLDRDCSVGKRKRLVCHKNVEEKVRIKFKNMPALESSQKEKFVLSSYSDPNRKKVRFVLSAKNINHYKISHRTRDFIIVKYVGKKNGKNESSENSNELTEELEEQKAQDDKILAEHNENAAPGKCESCGKNCLSIDQDKFFAAEKLSPIP
jgi:hypothetical protein